MKTQKELLGFIDNIPINIITGNNTYEYKDFFKKLGARYIKYWGWYFPSNIIPKESLPSQFSLLSLSWNKIGNENGILNSEFEIKKYIDSILYPDDNPSQFVGTVSERILIKATLERVIETSFGSNMITFKDENQNIFIWFTQTIPWDEGKTYTFRATVKDHKIYRNVRQTVITRCYKLEEK